MIFSEKTRQRLNLTCRGYGEVTTLQPINFNITMARTYRWQAENPRDQLNFISSLIQLFHTVSQGSLPLNITGFRFPDAAPTASSMSSSLSEMTRVQWSVYSIEVKTPAHRPRQWKADGARSYANERHSLAPSIAQETRSDRSSEWARADYQSERTLRRVSSSGAPHALKAAASSDTCSERDVRSYHCSAPAHSGSC